MWVEKRDEEVRWVWGLKRDSEGFANIRESGLLSYCSKMMPNLAV